MTRRGSRKRSNDEFSPPKILEPCEWVGGVVWPPFYVDDDPGAPARVGLALWLELGTGMIVGQGLVEEGGPPGTLGRVLRDCVDEQRSMGGALPNRIRVADAGSALEVERALRNPPPIEIAPTPELDALMNVMLDAMSDRFGGVSYLEDGRIRPTTIEKLFRAALPLHALKPWEKVDDSQIIRVDIPRLGVEAACIVVIGQLEETRGFLIFDSIDAYDRFVDAADRPRPGPGSGSGERPDFGAGWLAFEFLRGSDLSDEMRREVMQHAWPVASTDAYPRVDRFEADGAPRPVDDRDLAIATACATGLASFSARHADCFEDSDPMPICESFFDDDDREVRLTYPAEAGEAFEINDPAAREPVRAAQRIGRNDPCPCGSGKKYKKCHEGEPIAAGPVDRLGPRPGADRSIDSAHALDRALVPRLHRFAVARFGPDWMEEAVQDFADYRESIQLAGPFAFHQVPIEGRTVAEWFRARHAKDLSGADRRWLAAQAASWLSVWEVVDIVRGESIELLDLLSGERRVVRERTGSQTTERGITMLARIVDYDGRSLLAGVHPNVLPPLDGAEVVERARGRLRRRREVPIERLREIEFARYLIRRWEQAVDEVERRAAHPPELRNSDGDEILPTTDRFRLERSARAEIERRLATLEGVAPKPERRGKVARFEILRGARDSSAPMQQVVLGHITVEESALRIEANSRARADALRAEVEAVCGPLVQHRVRDHADPMSPPNRERAARAPVSRESPPPEVVQLLLDYKRRHYADWVDQEIPALGGKTPRAMVTTKRGRERVAALIKDMEYHERQLDPAEAFDFDSIRRELGIPT